MNSDNKQVYVLFRDNILIGVYTKKEIAEEQMYDDREYQLVVRWLDTSIEH